jgi:hypothetical protein
MTNQIALNTTVENFPVGTTLSGYSIVMTGAVTGNLPAFTAPVGATNVSTPVLAADTWFATITSVQADGVTPVPGAPVVKTNSIVVSTPQTVPLAVVTSATLS